MTKGWGAAEIFISHSSADKPVVRGIVEELKAILMQQGCSMEVFIDRPLELDGASPADTWLQINQDWEQQLNIQLQGCRVVLVFWSAKAKLSSWVQAEASRGFEDVSEDGEPKLFNVTLDDEGAAHFGSQVVISKRLACRLHLLDQAHLRTDALVQLAHAIATYIEKPRKPKPGPKVPVEVLPYLINCSSQIGSIRAELGSRLKPAAPLTAIGATELPQRQPLFAIAGYGDDSPEMLIQRIVKHDLPKLAHELALPPGQQPMEKIAGIGWRRERDSSGAGKAMQRDMLNLLKDVGLFRERPGLVVTTIEEPEKGDLEQLTNWLDGWEKAFTQHPNARAVPLLVVVDRQPGFFSGLPVGNKFLQAVNAHDGRKTCGVCVDRLPPLSRNDALEWCINFLPPGKDDLHRAVSKFIERKFAKAGKGKGPRLGAFANSVMSQDEAPWWNVLKRHYGG